MHTTNETRREVAASAGLVVEKFSNSSVPAHHSEINRIDAAARKIAARCSIPISIIMVHLMVNAGGAFHG
ncbi:hypothetical protein [Labrys monachus]|uniref:Uncharacterized protein n=1 Tax=Labrys monachus TaxID=217067 RepID=A0ABU0FKS7_9HYPH|nr:hypothetical protein [Labrys monachus]MDQ0395195.1 hypothetical protein [Labrys monachus]